LQAIEKLAIVHISCCPIMYVWLNKRVTFMLKAWNLKIQEQETIAITTLFAVREFDYVNYYIDKEYMVVFWLLCCLPWNERWEVTLSRMIGLRAKLNFCWLELWKNFGLFQFGLCFQMITDMPRFHSFRFNLCISIKSIVVYILTAGETLVTLGI